MKNVIIKYLIFIIPFFIACTKTVSPDIKGAKSRVVIEGKITNQKPPYYVQLSKTSGLDADKRDSLQGKSIVIIKDNTTKTIDTLKKISSLLYQTKNIKGISGHSYKLNVIIGSQNYTASCTMPKLVKCDSLTFSHFNDAGKNITYAVMNYTDPVKTHNYYTFTEYINSVRLAVTTFVFDDRLSDGKILSVPLLTYENYLKKDDSVTIEMSSVQEEVYNYFYALSLSSDPQNVSPSNPASNITGNVLGYFSAEAVSKVSNKVQ